MSGHARRYVTSRPGSAFPDTSLKGAAPRCREAMARPGHGRRRVSPEEEEDEEDPVDAMVSRTGCMAQHRALQHCMAEQQDWRHCQPQVRAFRDCMAHRKQDREVQRAPSSSHGHPAPTGE
ncbi:cytochrome c oxidase assembly factor 4 homolog, mitochondrial isoform X1 [Neopsephotus bourkii]|uniref:cytochrome c oxidase assembly factor 4 homolog, mitochondrial isoform X1 n=1 Tax=Neopsephotus bourkii TaxID=309878 RepID=UPI002AA576FF|nr:cytochrome c oxidase assembly factor 4 homolog, mitochondrial isoform X1 [Neopsephotus bourkii]